MIHATWDREHSGGWRIVVKKDLYMTMPPVEGDIVIVSSRVNGPKLVKLGRLVGYTTYASGLVKWMFTVGETATRKRGDDGVIEEWEAWARSCNQESGTGQTV